MRKLICRARWALLTLGAAGLYQLGGCGLTDQQLASIWSSVLTTGLNTIVTNVLTAAAGAAPA
jgi:hypothetical protein